MAKIMDDSFSEDLYNSLMLENVLGDATIGPAIDYSILSESKKNNHGGLFESSDEPQDQDEKMWKDAMNNAAEELTNLGGTADDPTMLDDGDLIDSVI